MDERIREALRTVIDPELGIDVVSLGLVRSVEVAEDEVRVRMTMTTPACPLGPQIRDEAVDAVREAVPEASRVDVELVWDPPWTPDEMSEEARRRLGWG